MAFDGYLVKIYGTENVNTDYEIPYKYIKFDSYQVFQSTTDLDSYRDQTGRLQRTALTHKPVKVEFETPAMLTNEDFAAFMLQIRIRYINATEKKVSARVYVPEIDDYEDQDMYIPDIQPSIYRYNKAIGKLQYNPIRIALIGY